MEFFGPPSTLSQIGIFYTVGVVVAHCINTDFGSDRHIVAGSKLALEPCVTLTEECWEFLPPGPQLPGPIRLHGTKLCIGPAIAVNGESTTDASLELVPCSAPMLNFSFQHDGTIEAALPTSRCLEYSSDDSETAKLTLGQCNDPFDIDSTKCVDGAPGHVIKTKDLSSRCVVALGTDTEEQAYGTIKFAVFGPQIFTAIPLICFSFFCHATFPMIFDSLKGRSVSKMAVVSTSTMLLCLVLYLLIGFCGYLLLGDATTADVLRGLNSHTGQLQVDVSIARACVAVKVACSYAMLSFVARNCIKDLVLGQRRELTLAQFALLSICFIFVTMMVAIFVPGIQTVMGFAGVAVVIMAFIFPGCLLRKMKIRRCDATVGLMLILLGIVVGGISFAVQVLNVMKEIKS